MTPHYQPAHVAAAFGVAPTSTEYLGTGSFGETWRVEADDGTTTACKIFYTDDFPPERLAREVDGLQRIDHPRVVRLIEQSTVRIADTERAMLRFSYVPGGDLTRVLNDGRPLPASDVTGLLAGLLEAAVALHDAQIVHRDIKPANIVLRDGEASNPVLLDLGLAKPLDVSSMTAYPQWIGSPPYMAPEQLHGQRARNSADLWAIGVVAAQAALGAHPYWNDATAADPSLLLAAHTNLAPGLPNTLDEQTVAVVRKLLSFRKAARGSARSALTQLDAFSQEMR